jgi:hypothetical protein
VHGLRDLDRSTYFGLFLFGLFNPVVTSMRVLCAATRLNRVSGMLDLQGSVAISGFSNAQHVFAPEILEPVVKDLLIESLAKQTGPIKAGRFGPEAIQIFDSTVWKVVNRMSWAKWRYQHTQQNAVRLQNEVKWEVIESHPLSPEAIARGVTLDATVRLGHRGAGGIRRIFASSRHCCWRN